MIEATRIESAVDWITATTQNAKDTALMYGRAEKMAIRESDYGNVVKPWGMSGYSGWAVGQVQYGSRDGEGIVRLSGRTAAEDWFDIYQLCERVTRIDIQETYRLSSDVTRFVVDQYRRGKRYLAKHNPQKRMAIYTGNDGGATCYSGSRQSERMLRLYNKAVESKDDYYRDCVRLEGEYKGESARAIARRLSDGSWPMATICGVLHDAATGCGWVVPWSGVCLTPISVPRAKPDSVVMLSWLLKQVRPSVRTLIAQGLLCEVAEALGLTIEDVRTLVKCPKLRNHSTEGNQNQCQSIESQ